MKAVAERMLLNGGPAALYRRLGRGRFLILAYHNILPDGEISTGETSLHLPRRAFAMQLDLLLEEEVEVVSLDSLVEAALRPESGDRLRRVAITFDDGYRGAIQVGVEELVFRGLPATFFVVPERVGGHAFWWDALSVNGSLSPAFRSAALAETDGRTENVVAWAHSRGCRVGPVPAHALSATEAELQAAADCPGITMASHTWSHPNLARLDEEECRREFCLAVDWLRQRFNRQSRLVSYPYGMFSNATQVAAAAAGHDGALRIEGGSLSVPISKSDMFRLSRLNIAADLSNEGFGLRIAGLLCG